MPPVTGQTRATSDAFSTQPNNGRRLVIELDRPSCRSSDLAGVVSHVVFQSMRINSGLNTTPRGADITVTVINSSMIFLMSGWMHASVHRSCRGHRRSGWPPGWYGSFGEHRIPGDLRPQLTCPAPQPTAVDSTLGEHRSQIIQPPATQPVSCNAPMSTFLPSANRR
jgi:hypothetical protein